MKYIFILFFSLVHIKSSTQNHARIWYFGDGAGLNFTSTGLNALSNGKTYNRQGHSEGTSVISDNQGNLLFYTNGEEVWNRNQIVMPNGSGLLGDLSSSQNLIIPKPGSNNLFYVFTIDSFQNKLANGLRYSVVDMCLNNGLGDVLISEKNKLLLNEPAEKITAIKHSNGVDYWVITHKYNSDAFYSFLLTSSGITSTVTTNIGSIHKDYCIGSTEPYKAALGQLKAAPNGRKVIIVNGQGCNNISELFDFDNSTGILSNMVNLQTDNVAVGLYGTSFSPDSSKLYISSYINNDKVYQYDLSLNNPSSIINSKTIVGNHFGGPWFTGMQLGIDGKIYIAIRNQSSIAVINHPNLSGTSCNLVDGAISLNGKNCSLGLPNFIDSFNYSNTNGKCTTLKVNHNLESEKIIIYPNPLKDKSILFFNNMNKEKYTLTIHNILGQLKRKIDNITGSQFELIKGNLSPGIYFIELKYRNKTSGSYKLVVR